MISRVHQCARRMISWVHQCPKRILKVFFKTSQLPSDIKSFYVKSRSHYWAVLFLIRFQCNWSPWVVMYMIWYPYPSSEIWSEEWSACVQLFVSQREREGGGNVFISRKEANSLTVSSVVCVYSQCTNCNTKTWTRFQEGSDSKLTGTKQHLNQLQLFADHWSEMCFYFICHFTCHFMETVWRVCCYFRKCAFSFIV